MTTAADRPGTTKPLAVIIIGADALLVARPATAIQLWHGCLAAGYELAVPATWGDELIAAEALRALPSHPTPVAVMCSCPLVARTIPRLGEDVAPHLISLVAPPVATARYLRRVHGERRVHITFVGACPSAADSAIDAWIAPTELLDRFEAAGIVLREQPELFESVIPPDRRRHLSQPGGLPTSERAATMPRPRLVHEIDDADIVGAVRRHLGGSVRSLLDFGPRAGCTCSGAMAGVAPNEARAMVTVLEPPRSARPVILDPAGLGLTRRLPVLAWPRDPEPARERSNVDRVERPAAAARPVAVPAHATRTPLSWHLREHAIPQPSATARRAPTPEAHGRGAQPTEGAVNVDADAVAAARALEVASAARTIHRVISEPALAVATTATTSSPGGGPVAATSAAAPPTEREASAARAPGRYWFAAKAAAVTREGDAPPASAPPSLGGDRRRPELDLELVEEGIAFAGEMAMQAAESRAFTAAGRAHAVARMPAAKPNVISVGGPALDLRALRARAAGVRAVLDRPGDAVVAAVVIVLLVVLLMISLPSGDDADGASDSTVEGATAAEATDTLATAPVSPLRPVGGAGAATLPPAVTRVERGAALNRVIAPPSRGASVAPPTSPAGRSTAVLPRPDTGTAAQGRGGAARDSATADSIARAAASRAELDSIRAELLRSRARIDSLARANSLLVVPRPPGTPPPPPPPAAGR